MISAQEVVLPAGMQFINVGFIKLHVRLSPNKDTVYCNQNV